MKEKLSSPVVSASQIVDTLKVTASTALEPLRSLYLWYGYRDQGILGRYVRAAYAASNEHTLDDFFGHHEMPTYSFEEFSETPKLLADISSRFKNKAGEPQNFVGVECASKWQLMKNNLEEVLGEAMPGTAMLDYLGVSESDHSLYFQQGPALRMVKIPKNQDLRIDATEIAERITQESSVVELADPLSSVSIELGISTIEARHANSAGSLVPVEVRRVSSIGNDFYYKRHDGLEREGKFFTGLRHMGVHSLGEMQTVSRMLFDQGWKINIETGAVEVMPDLERMWSDIRGLPYEMLHETIEKPSSSELEMETTRYIEEQAYYRVVVEYLRDNKMTRDFVQSELYKKYSAAFRSRHMAAMGASELKTAQAMLAGIYLYAFEGSELPDSSPSQTYLAKVSGYHEELSGYITDYLTRESGLPIVGEKSQSMLASSRKFVFAETLKQIPPERLSHSNLLTFRVLEDEAAKAINQAADCMAYARGQMSRNPVHRKVIEYFNNLGVIASEGAESRVGMAEVLIGNGLLKLVDVHGEKRFLFPWLKKASGYLGPDLQGELPPISEAENLGIEEVLKNIFSGEVEKEGHPYLAQEARIIRHAGTIIEYLKTSKEVPVSVRKFISSLVSSEGLTKVMETMGGVADNDPNIVNRFFPDGLEEFQRASIYRYVFDFVRGVESNILIQEGRKSGGLKKAALMAEMWVGNWRNHDFSGIGNGMMREAVKATLKDGHSRLLELNHAVKDVNKIAAALDLTEEEKIEVKSTKYQKSWKTIQDEMETVFGWDTTSMKYLRWQGFWNVWNTLGAAWDCICFTRKTIFNPRTLRAGY